MLFNDCFRPDGTTFPAEYHHEVPVKEGDIVTFSYDSYSRRKLIPVNPKIIRVRNDISWQQVVATHANESPFQLSLNGIDYLQLYLLTTNRRYSKTDRVYRTPRGILDQQQGQKHAILFRKCS